MIFPSCTHYIVLRRRQTRTRAAIAQAVGDGKAAAVNDAMVSKRLAFMRTLSNYANNPAWVKRAESFKTGTP